MGRLLRSGAPDGLRGRVIKDAELGLAWGALLHAVRTGETPFEHVFGEGAFDGTAPRFPGRGCQTALIRRRVADAAAAGCEPVATQTDPGTTSQRNMERAGFRTAYTRTVWAPTAREGPA